MSVYVDNKTNIKIQVAVPREQREPDRFHGNSEQITLWNRWKNTEKALQLSMCLIGEAKSVL